MREDADETVVGVDIKEGSVSRRALHLKWNHWLFGFLYILQSD